MSFQRNSTLRQAFDSIQVRNVAAHCVNPENGIVHKIMNSLERKVGMIRERSWNLNASRKSIEEINKATGLTLKASA